MTELNEQYCKFVGVYAKIYTLSDVNGNVFYVGCTVLAMPQRIKQHISEARANRPYSNRLKNEKIRSLGFNIVAIVVDMIWVTGRKANQLRPKTDKLEASWILKFRSLGYDLLNRLPRKKIHKNDEIKEYVGQRYTISADTIKEILEEDTADEPKNYEVKTKATSDN